MGQFEKIVVLLSFFLVTVILVISFSSDEEKHYPMGSADDDLSVAEAERLSSEVPEPATLPAEEGLVGEGGADLEDDLGLLSLQERRDREAAASGGAGGGEVPDLILDSANSNRANSNRPGPRAKTLPAGAALITLEGLTDTFDDEIKAYTSRGGDTLESVATRLYGDPEKSGLLQRFNEDFSSQGAGAKIMVPVFDRRSPADRVAVDVDEAPPSVASGTLYKVVDGDSLWLISKKVYGKGADWEKIFEANTDQLESADDLATGQELRIP